MSGITLGRSILCNPEAIYDIIIILQEPAERNNDDVHLSTTNIGRGSYERTSLQPARHYQSRRVVEGFPR